MPTLLINNSNGLTCAALREQAPTTNFSGGSAQEAGCYTSGDRKQWLFDFGAAPSLGGTASFSAGALELYCQDTNASVNDFDVYLLTSPTAVRSQATWAVRSTGVNWGTAGGLGSGDVNMTPLASVADWVISTRRSFTSAAMAAAIQDWCNGVTSGLQLLVVRNPSTAYDLTFNEFRSTGWGSPDWPTLTGTYTVSTDPTVTTVSSNSATEGSAITHTVTLSAATTGTTNYAATLTGVTATGSGTDFTSALGSATYSNSVTFSGGNMVVPSGVSSFTVTISTAADTLDEDNETYTLTVGGQSGTGTINDDDALPAFELTSSVTEDAGDDVVITVTVTPVSGRATGGTLSMADGTATGGVDYTNTVTNGMLSNGVTISAGVLTVPAGVSSFTLTIPTVA